MADEDEYYPPNVNDYVMRCTDAGWIIYQDRPLPGDKCDRWSEITDQAARIRFGPHPDPEVVVVAFLTGVITGIYT